MTELGHDLEKTDADEAPARPRKRSIGELVIDLVLVAAISVYLYVAQSYPPDGRQIPTVVGVIGLAAALIQLIGWFVRPLWTFTHGDATPGSSARSSVEGQAALSPVTAATDGTGTGSESAPTRQSRDTVVIIAWAAGFLGAILAIGYEYGVPLFFLAYFLWRRSWRLAIVLAVVMWALTRFVFIDLLTVPLPTGEFF